MTSLIIRMVREIEGETPYHVDVHAGGRMEALGGERMINPRVAKELMAVNDKRKSLAKREVLPITEESPARNAQLLTIRFLSLMGWRVSDPSLWTEVNHESKDIQTANA